MAEVLGLKQPSVHRYEIGDSFIPTTVWKKIHNKFNYSLEYLLNGQGKKKNTEPKKENLITDIKDIQQKYEILSHKYEDLNSKMNKLFRDYYSKDSE